MRVLLPRSVWGATIAIMTMLLPLQGTVNVSAAGQPQTFTYSPTFSSDGQSMWGPGPSFTGPSGFNFLDYSWNKSGTTGSIRNVCKSTVVFGTVCTDNGATLTGSTTGEIGLRLRYDNPTSGYVNVNYPVQVSLNEQPISGGAITIDSSWTPAPGGSMHTQSATNAAHLEALLKMGMTGSDYVCVLSVCTSTTLANNPNAVDTGWTQIANTLTADQPTAPIGKLGVSGSVQFPSVATTTNQTQPDGSLQSSGSDTFLDMNVDLVSLINELAGDPVPTSLTTGPLSYDTLSAALDMQAQLRQNFVFKGDGVKITLDFGGVPAKYEVLAQDGTVAASGNGTSVTFEAGQHVKIFQPVGTGILHVTPHLALKNTFESLDGLEDVDTLQAQALSFSASIAGHSYSVGPVMNEQENVPVCKAQVFALSMVPTIAPYGCDQGANFWMTLPGADYNTWQLGGFNSAQEQPFNLIFDTTPPVTTAALTPPANGNGWDNADTTVTLNAIDLPNDGTASGVDKTYYAIDNPACVSSSPSSCTVYNAASKPVVSAEGTHTLYFFSVDNAGNYESQKSLAVNVDKTKPAIQGGPVNNDGSMRPPNNFGWYNSNVEVHFTCQDPLPADRGTPSGIDSCQGNTTLGEGANQTVTGTAQDKAGNVSNFTAGPFNIDETRPVVTYAGNAGAYTVDQTVNITCNVTDPTSHGTASGIDPGTNTCQNISGPAYTFEVANDAGLGGPGVNSYSAQVYDKAGNKGAGATTFTVRATFDSLCTLTQRFSSDSGVAGGLCAKLAAAAADQAAGQTNPMDNVLDAYNHQVAAQNGKALTAQQADTLTKLAEALM